MKASIVGGVVAFLIGSAHAADTAPSFTDYPAQEQLSGQPAKPLLVGKKAHDFRTVLKQEAARGPNFAGHFTIARWGCGAACISWAIIDARDGNVWFAPFTVSAPACSEAPDYCQQSLDFNINSELIVAVGSRNELGAGQYFYRWHAGNLSLLSSTESVNAAQP
jgi:hypothetical protein